MRLAKIITLLLAMLLLSACARTVEWEEEVPLNTGETIWVQRSMPWVYKGGMGNPFDMAMRPTGEQTIRFKYRDKAYSFTGKVHIGWLAISPSMQPVLVAHPADYGWHSQYENAYYCVIPYYVQFVPDTTGTKWTWPEKISPWLYNLPANLMSNKPTLEENRGRYSAIARDDRDKNYRLLGLYRRQIDPLYDANSECGKKYDPSMKPKSE
jgi:hypothetical protein